MRRTRSGPSIREFLEYYVLVLLAEKERTQAELVQEIKQRSFENRAYRPSGVLWIASSEMAAVLSALQSAGLSERQGDGQWAITLQGRLARQRKENESQSQSGAKEEAAAKLLARLGEPSTQNCVLDVGTGEGFLARRLAERGFQVLGIDRGSFDYGEEDSGQARKETSSQGGRVEFRQADIRKLEEADSSFDYVVSSQAMHCMQNQRACLEAIHRLLKPGGTFLCMDFRVGLRGFLARGWHCFLAISREEWIELLPGHGLVLVGMHEVDDYLLVEAEKPA